MSAIAEIDKSGRLIVPKKLRDALHLVPGTRLTLHQQGDSIVMTHESAATRGLVEVGRFLVHHSGVAPDPSFDLVAFIEAEREERLRHLLGDHQQ